MTLSFSSPYFLWCIFLVGACIGSYLNVVIYRIPRNLKVNNPKRSLCPQCNALIPIYRNIPILSWILLSGKSKCCGGRIPIRYFVVELTTAILFVWIWRICDGEGSFLLGWVFVALLISIALIDADFFIIPVHWCWLGSIIAIVGSPFFSDLIFYADPILLGSNAGTSRDSFWYSIAGFLGGYLILLGVVFFGKKVFGNQQLSFDTAKVWSLKESPSASGGVRFKLGEDHYDWDDLFYRKSDMITITGATKLCVNGQPIETKSVFISRTEVRSDQERILLEEIKSCQGSGRNFRLPREAMGGGDPPLLAMIGAFLGLPAVLFTILASSLYALLFAFIGKIGFGQPLPFGPFLVLGAFTWLLGGHVLFTWYLELMTQ